MPNSASSVLRLLSHGLFVLAALFLALGPSLDTAAHAATRSDQIDHPVSQVLAAFDVIEDVTDHFPGDPPKAQNQQLLLAVAWPEPAQPIVEGPDAPDRNWASGPMRPLISTLPDSKDDPPRG
tara:strand:+ start:2161 stop:2529 length:369 start_codon:yes stop_codon:yes gene_type:complete